MIPYTKKRDMEARAMVLETMEIALRLGMIDQAKEFGTHSKRLADKLKTHDYSKDFNYQPN